MEISMVSVLVTGAAGFIGSNLARRLIDDGHDVTTVDNLTTGRASNVPEDCELIVADLHDRSTINGLCRRKFDVIYHVAGQSGGIPSFDDPVYDLQANVQSTLLLMDYAKQSGCPTFVYASSMAVYGDPANLPVSEEDRLDPKTFYAVGKVASESYMRLYAQQGLGCTALRLNNTYGPGQDLANLSQGMASIYIGQAIATRRILVKGSPSRVRDLVYVDDVVDAFIAAGDAAKPEQFRTFNVATGVGTSVEDVLAMITSGLPFPVQIEVEGATPGDQHGIYCSYDLIARELGWTPEVGVETGIRRMVQWALATAGEAGAGVDEP
jgi:UDP-glucose 4-epimerase